MLIVENCLVSEDISEVNFVCDIKKCKGVCCIEGDAGAPLDEEEIGILEDILEDISPYMTSEGLAAIKENGNVFDYDIEGNFVTPLVNGCECVFTVVEDGIVLCAIEKAWKDGIIDFQKPISCHLYPVRISNCGEHEALNYHCWQICKDALRKGKEERIALYKFLKVPLIRKYGKEWFRELDKQTGKE